MADSNALASSSKHSSSHHDEPHRSKKHRKDKHRERESHGESSRKHKEKSRDRSGKEGKHRDSKSHKEKKDRGPFEHRHSTMRLSIPPLYSNDWMMGAVEVLNGMIMRYVPQMGGVLLAHWEHSFPDSSLKIINESPFGICEVQFHSILWAPSLGQKLYGTHSLSSPSHLSLLFSKTFNVSIPLQHIPTDEYEFEHTAEEAELDDESDEDSDSEDGDFGLLGGRAAVHEVGRWRNKKTGKYVGEDGEGLKFTVIGMQVTNQMLSLTGSLLGDPSNPPPPPSPRHIPLPTSPSVSPEPEAAAFTRPAKRSKQSVPQAISYPVNGHTPPRVNGTSSTPAKASAKSVAAAAEEAPVVDERFLSARELKAKRKAEQKAKKENRKSRKEERALEEIQDAGGEAMVGMDESVAVAKTEEADPALNGGSGGGGKKRKGDGEEGKERKKRKERA